MIRRMARDLDFPTEVVVVPTVREPDGLAMSSRNAYLDAAERERATALNRALAAADAAQRRGRRGRPRRRPRRSSPRPGSSPSTSRPATRTTSSRHRASTDGPFSWPSPRGSARPASSTTWSSTPAIPPILRRRTMQRQMLKSKIHRATVTAATWTTSARSPSTRADAGRGPDPQRAGARLGRHQRLALRHLRDRGRARQARDAGERRRRPPHPRGHTIIVASFGAYDESTSRATRRSPSTSTSERDRRIDSHPEVLWTRRSQARRRYEHATSEPSPRDRKPVTLPSSAR